MTCRLIGDYSDREFDLYSSPKYQKETKYSNALFDPGLLRLTPLSAQISASNFHDLTQITQRRVCFNPKRTEKPKAHGFSVRFGLKHTLREVVVVLIANITLRRGVI